MNIREKGFIHKYHFICGVIGCLVIVINMIMIMLLKNGVLRMKYHLFWWVILPNTVSKVLLTVWVLHYCYTLTYKRDINIFARDILIVIIANILVIAFDESSTLYYIAQAIPCLIIFIFMLVAIARLRDSLQDQRDLNRIIVVNTLIYLMIVLQAFISAISFSDNDPYLVTFIGISYFGLMICIIGLNKIEKSAQPAFVGESDQGSAMDPSDEGLLDFEDEEDFDDTEDEFF